MNLIDFERADRSRNGLDENTGLFLFQLSELLSVPAVTGAEQKTGTLYSDEDYAARTVSPLTVFRMGN